MVPSDKRFSKEGLIYVIKVKEKHGVLTLQLH